MYNRHPILPIDIKYDLIDNNADKEPESNPYDIITFKAVPESAALVREATYEKASQNIKKGLKLSITRNITSPQHNINNIAYWIQVALSESKTTG